MPKSVVLLLVLGTVLALWIGSNPHARQQAAQDWEKTKQAFVKIKTDLSVKTHEWAVQLNSREQTNSKSEPKPLTVAWRQISSAFEALWNSLQQVWLSISARIHLRNQ